jgi:YNFM family putative membrane transporter
MSTLVRLPDRQHRHAGHRHAGHRPGSPEYRRVLVALFAAGMATFALLYSTQALLPELAGEFGVSATESTLTMSLTTAALAVSLLVVGPLSDRVGRTRLIHLSLAASTLVAAACAVAPTWDALLALRLVEGVTLAGLPAVATAFLREELHPSTHGRAAGLYVGGTALGGMAGRLVTAPVAELLGWRWALAATALLALGCTMLVAMTLPASRNFEARPGGEASFGAMALLALRDRTLLALYAVGSVAVGTLVALFNVLGFRLTEAPFHLGVGAVSLVFLVYPLGAVSSAVAGRLADACGRGSIAPIGCVVATAGVLLTLPESLPAIVAGVAAVTVGFFMIHAVASGWVAARAHAAGISTGQAAAFYLFFYYVGSSVFGSLGGRAWSTAGWPAVVALAVLLLGSAGGLSLTLRRVPSRAA